jgi:hypothetical protein
LNSFLDEYSRDAVQPEVLLGLNGLTTSLTAQKTIERCRKGLTASRSRRSNFAPIMAALHPEGVAGGAQEERFAARRIQPHCPEENGLIERASWTMREGIEVEDRPNYLELKCVLEKLVKRYKHERFHNALSYLPPWLFYRGDPSRRSRSSRSSCPRSDITAARETSNWVSQLYPWRAGRLLLLTELVLYHLR